MPKLSNAGFNALTKRRDELNRTLSDVLAKITGLESQLEDERKSVDRIKMMILDINSDLAG